MGKRHRKKLKNLQPGERADPDGASERSGSPGHAEQEQVSPPAMETMAGARTRDLVEVLRPVLEADPWDRQSQLLYAQALREAFARGLDVAPSEKCFCSSGERYDRCCRGAEVDLVGEFLDREPIYELREAMNPFLEEPEAQTILTRRALAWVKAGLGDPHENEGLTRMFYDWAVLGPSRPGPSEADRSILRLFSRRSSAPEGLRERAAGMQRDHLMGLWQTRETAASPGLPMVDLLSATSVYVACAEEQLEGLKPWTVMMGPIHAVGGTWGLGGSMVHLSPLEADMLSRDLFARARQAASRDRTYRLPAFLKGWAELPASGAVDARQPVSSAETQLLSTVIHRAFPALISKVFELRNKPKQVRNTDGDPVLLIEAKLRVADPRRTLADLENHPDFEHGDDGRVTWFGREMTEDEVSMQREQARAIAAEQGGELLEGEEGSHRWIRGWLKLQDGLITASTNSERRFDDLLAVLRIIDSEPQVVDQTRIDPSLDLPQVSSITVGFGRAMPPGQFKAWARAWVDEQVPALAAMTPRQASASPDGRIRLEALLRQFEYEAFGTDAAEQVHDLRSTLALLAHD